MRSFFLGVLPILMLGAPLDAEEAPPRPRLEFEYFTEDLESDPGVVSGSGCIQLRYQDFVLSIPDGGVVIWVDPGGWRKLRAGLGGSGDEKKEEGEEGKEGQGTAPAIESLLGPVIRELYAEGDVTLERGGEHVRAGRIYYDFVRDRAVIFDAEVVYQYVSRRKTLHVPLTVRAERIRQVAKDRVEAGPARVTTCLYGEPHWEITIDEISITHGADGFWAESRGNVLRVWDTPVFWFPWLFAGEDTGLEPLRGGNLGRSSRYGYFAEVRLGSGIRFGDEGGKPWGKWKLSPVYRSRRGPGLGLDLEYGGDDYRGDLLAFYQRDDQNEDRVTGYEIPRKDRGRVRWRHRHDLDRDLWGGRLTALAEISWLSDRGFLEEYYTSEARQAKAQENVGYLDWAGGRHALSLTGKWRANEFQTQTEYRPRLAYDLFSLPLAYDLAGTGLDLYLSGEVEGAKVRRVHDHRLDRRGTLTDRLTGRAAVTTPFSLGPVRVTPCFTAGFTEYEGGQDASRRDLSASVTAAVDFWRLWPEVTSKTFELAGLRHVIDVSLTWSNRFAVTEASRELVVQDPQDLLDEFHAFDLRIRNRFQTKREGAVVDWIDLEARALFFPEETPSRPAPFLSREEWTLGIPHLLVPEEEKFRSMRRRGFGPLLGRLRARLREGLFFGADLWYDVETNRFETYATGVRYEAYPALSFFLGHSGIQGDSSVLTGWADFRISDRWGARAYQQYDFRQDGGLASGVTLRRYFHDFLLEFTFRHDFGEDDTSFNVSVDPSVLFESKRAREASGALSFDDMRWYR